MTANIALSCIGVIFTLLWLWWVCYSVKTLRKFEKTTRADGEEVLIVREKVWRKSMARLLRRDEDDDVNGIKRIVTGGLVDLIEIQSRRSVNNLSISRSRHNSTRHHGHRHGHGTTTGNGTMIMPPGLGLGASTPRPSQESERSSLDVSDERQHTTSPRFGERRNTEEILQSLPRTRGDMPPPPYMGQPQAQAQSSEGTGTNTQTLSSSGGEGTNISQESPGSNQAFLLGTSLGSASASGSGTGPGGMSSTSNRPLPLAPPEVERVLDRKMDEMASTGGTYMSGSGMDAFTATRLGLGPVAQLTNKGEPGMSGPSGSGPSGSGTQHRMEDLVDQKLDTYALQSPTSTSRQHITGPGLASGSLPRRQETIEQLVDRKIAYADPRAPSPSSAGQHDPHDQSPPSFAVGGSHRYSSTGEINTSPISMNPHSANIQDSLTSTWPGSNPPPSFHANTISSTLTPLSLPITNINNRKGKAAEAGFSIESPHDNRLRAESGDNARDDAAAEGSLRTPLIEGMTLEEMIERKMASMRQQSQSQSHQTGSQHQNESGHEHKGRPHPIAFRSGVAGPGAGSQRRRSKGKRKTRPRAGSDPGPKLPKHEETEEEEDEGGLGDG